MDATAKDVAMRYFAQILPPSDIASARALVSATAIPSPAEPFVPSPFKVTELISGINTAVGALCNMISKERLGRTQEIVVDAVNATASLTTHYSYQIDDMSSPESMGYLATSLGYNDPLRLWRSMTNHTWRCKDGKYIVFYTRPADNPPKLLNALGFSKQEIEKMLPMLETPEGRKEYFGLVERKIETWNSDDLEKRIIELNATATIVGQTREGFLASEHGQIAQKWPVMELFKREGWAPSPWPELVPGKHGILHGIKVLEVTRVLLGPRAGCLLAALGATVVRVNSPLIDEGPVLDVNLGKTSLHLELKKDADRKVFEELVRDADVILSNNALGVMDRMGFGFDACLELVKGRNRGLVYAEATAFGFSGPYATAGGYEHLAHFLTGIGHTQGLHHQYDTGKQEGKPVAVPINVLDISTGHTLAMGAIEALRRRANQGGSWLVQTSLLQVGMMMQSLGEHPAEVVEKAWGPYQPEPSTVDPERPFGGGSFGYFASFQCFLFRGGCPSAYKPEYLMTIKDCPWLPAGHTVKTVKPALEMGETPVRYRLSTRPFGFDSKHGRREFVDLHDGGDLVEEEHGIFRFVGKQAVGKL